MFQERNLEEKLQHTEHKMNEFMIGLEKLDREYQSLLNTLGLTSEQIHAHLSEKNNFSQPIWEALQIQKKTLDDKLDLAVKGVKDPKKLQETFSERATVQQHWLFVR